MTLGWEDKSQCRAGGWAFGKESCILNKEEKEIMLHASYGGFLKAAGVGPGQMTL